MTALSDSFRADSLGNLAEWFGNVDDGRALWISLCDEPLESVASLTLARLYKTTYLVEDLDHVFIFRLVSINASKQEHTCSGRFVALKGTSVKRRVLSPSNHCGQTFQCPFVWLTLQVHIVILVFFL